MKAEIRRIVLAEDDANDAELTSLALRSNKLTTEIVRARDGAETLDYLLSRGEYTGREPGNPALVLLDLKMPRVDGIEVLRAIKANPDLRTIPVVVLTSSREEQDLKQCYELGVNAYVVKPVEFAEFVEAIKTLGAFWGSINQPPSGSRR